MTIFPTSEALGIYAAEGYRYCPVAAEVLADVTTPLQALQLLKSSGKDVFWLDCAPDPEEPDRWTYVAFDPALTVEYRPGVLRMGKERIHTREPFPILDRFLADHKSPRPEGLPPFTGGLAGFVLPQKPTDAGADEPAEPLIRLRYFDRLLAFDALRHTLLIIVNIPLRNTEETSEAASGQIGQIQKLLSVPYTGDCAPGELLCDPFPTYSPERFIVMAKKAQERIMTACADRLTLSNLLQAPFCGGLLSALRQRQLDDVSAGQFYFSFGKTETVGGAAAPYFSLRGKTLTRFLRSQLQAKTPSCPALPTSADDPLQAAHTLEVDIARDFLLRLCRRESVTICAFHKPVSSPRASGFCSAVCGEPLTQTGAFGLLRSLLPVPAAIGAPAKACEPIADRLESAPRELFGGIFFLASLSGDSDAVYASSILSCHDGTLFAAAGVEITAETEPAYVYDLFRDQTAPLIDAAVSGYETPKDEEETTL